MVNKIKSKLRFILDAPRKIVALEKKVIELQKVEKSHSKTIVKLQAANKELNKVVRKDRESAILDRLRFVEYILGKEILDKYDNIDWNSVFSDVKKERVEYWKFLYRKGELELSDKLKFISKTYFTSYQCKISESKIFDSSNINEFFKSNLLVENSKDLFGEFVKNKSFRLRGPTTEYLPLDHDAQLTVVMNAYNLESSIDISYYNSSLFTKELSHVLGLLRNGLVKFAIVNKASLDTFNIPDDIKDRVILLNQFNYGFDSHLLGVQRVVYDLISRGASKVEIEGVNLYSKLPYHNKEYKNQVASEGDVLLNSWAVHDVIFNFCFLKSSVDYEYTKIEIIDDFSHLLELNKEEYMTLVMSNIQKEFNSKEVL